MDTAPLAIMTPQRQDRQAAPPAGPGTVHAITDLTLQQTTADLTDAPWGIENRLPRIRDATGAEDPSRSAPVTGPVVMAMLVQFRD